jgi:hypothetical protein
VRTPTLPSGKENKSPPKKSTAKDPPVAHRVEDLSSTFAKEAVKLSNPEFSKYLADLDHAFEPLKEFLTERQSESVILFSSIRNAHIIPWEIVTPFSEFTTVFRDFSILSAVNRKISSVDPPTSGNIHQFGIGESGMMNSRPTEWML